MEPVRIALHMLGRCLVLGLLGAGAAAAEPSDNTRPRPEPEPVLAAAAAEREDEGSPFSVGGHFELDFESEDNFDLDDGAARDVATLEPELQLEVTYQPGEDFFIYLVLESSRKIALWEEGPNRERDIKLEVEEAYLDVTDIALDGLGLRIGRQEFKDGREWLYDDELDGPRLFYRTGDLGFELSATRKTAVDRDVLNRDRKGRINNYFIYVQYDLDEDFFAAGYYFRRDDLSGDRESPQFIGLRSGGEAIDGLTHWLELVHVRGRDGAEKIRAFGLDVGATYKLDVPWTPYFTLGFAYGSGDPDGADQEDSNFRQTGLQDNDDKLGGVANVHYYGEAFQPELSNMQIYTAGVGFRPTRKSSADLIYHHYRQVEAADRLRDAEFNPDPNGIDKTLGNAIDLILAYREIPNLRLELVFGYFIPGNAFGSGADDALFTGFEMRYLF